MIAKSQPRFSLGQVVATPGALEALSQVNQQPAEFLNRHAQGDWGDVCVEDREANDQALIDGSRLLSAYHTSLGEKLWVITEAADDSGNRAATMILLPSSVHYRLSFLVFSAAGTLKSRRKCSTTSCH